MVNDFSVESIDPRNPDGPHVEVVLPGDLIEWCYKHRRTKYMNLLAAKAVLENPERVFFGVREYNEGGWCYVGRPSRWYIRENIDATFPSHYVFAVYVNPRLRIYEWRAEFAAEDDPDAPADWQSRYEELTWTSTS